MNNRFFEETNIHWYLPDEEQHTMNCFLQNINNIYEIAKVVYGNDIKIDISKVEDGGKIANIVLFAGILGHPTSIKDFISNASYKYHEVRHILTTIGDGWKDGKNKYNETQQRKIKENKNTFYKNKEATKIVFFQGEEDEDENKKIIYNNQYNEYITDINKYEDTDEGKITIIPLKQDFTINQVKKGRNNVCSFTEEDLKKIKKLLDEDKAIVIKKEESIKDEYYNLFGKKEV